MSDPALKITEIQALRQSVGWQLVTEALTAEMNKVLIPPQITGTVDEIAIATISRSAAYASLLWVRDSMISQLLERERKAISE